MNKFREIAVAGCVLAGGKSRRMGTDKAMLDLDGRPLIIHAIEGFSCFPEVLVSASDAEGYAFTGVRTVPDERPGLGPLVGFFSALRASDADYVCFRPVDVPFVPAELHSTLAGECIGKDAAVPTYKGLLEPLLVCLSKTALPALENLLDSGELKASLLFSMLDTAFVPLDTPDMRSSLGDPSAYLVNVNDPDSFAKLGKRHD